MNQRILLVVQVIFGVAAAAAIALTERPYDGWDYLGLVAFTGVAVTALVRLRRQRR